MYKPLAGTGRKISIGEGYPVTVTENMQRACNDATWCIIINDKHPGEGYDLKLADALERLRCELRAQVPHNSRDSSTDFADWHMTHIAKWLGSWDVRTGRSKASSAIVPIRSTMDIPLAPECAKHGLMHTCKA